MITWNEQYGIARARVGKLFDLEVQYSKDGYVAAVIGYNTIKLKPVATKKQAMTNAVTFAIQEMNKMIDMLKAETVK